MYFNLILKIRTIRHASNCKFITAINIKSLSIKIQYSEVNNVVIVQIMYVDMLALGFFCHKSFIVGTNHMNVTIHHIL